MHGTHVQTFWIKLLQTCNPKKFHQECRSATIGICSMQNSRWFCIPYLCSYRRSGQAGTQGFAACFHPGHWRPNGGKTGRADNPRHSTRADNRSDGLIQHNFIITCSRPWCSVSNSLPRQRAASDGDGSKLQTPVLSWGDQTRPQPR